MAVEHHEESRIFLEQEKHLSHMIRRRIPVYKDQVALKDRADGPWVTFTWEEMGKTVDMLAKALLALGIQPGDRVGIFSQNRAAWTLADLAILSIRGIVVPIYSTNSTEEAAYIVDDAGIVLLFVNDQEQYGKVLAMGRGEKSLKSVVAFSPDVRLDPELPDFSYRDFLNLGMGDRHGKALSQRLDTATLSDLYTLIYTSGTTGTPKGVMVTHENILMALYSSQYPSPLSRGGISLSFLPLSHVFERSWCWYTLSQGAQVCYCHELSQLRAFLAHTKPHCMVSTPRLWEKLHGTIMETLHTASPMRRGVFQWARRVGKAFNLQKSKGQPVGLGLRCAYFMAGLAGLRRIRALVGGRSKYHHVGGAPLNPEIIDLFTSAGVPLGLGYGLTEVFPLSIPTPGELNLGTSGRPMPLMEVRTGSNGELQAKGPCLMQGYWKRPDATTRAFTPDGWFKTGDVGHVTSQGHICITDRLKEIIVTSGGKSIPPQTIETAIKDDLYVEQVIAVGDGRPYISALIVPSFPLLESLARVMELSWDDRRSLVAHPEIISFYKYRIDQYTQRLGQVKKIKRFTLLPMELTQAAGELTPTLKLKRRVINQRYAHLIEEMYA